MSTDETRVVLLQDGNGGYYAIPLSVVEGYRVPVELRESVQATIALAPAVQGYVSSFQFGGLFEIEDFSFDIEQPLNIGSASSGAGAGKVTFNPFQVQPRG